MLILFALIFVFGCATKKNYVINTYPEYEYFDLEDEQQYRPPHIMAIKRTDLLLSTKRLPKTKLSDCKVQERHYFQNFINTTLDRILSNYIAPKADGKKYSGGINYFIEPDGTVYSKMFRKYSGHKGLDEAMLAAVLATQPFDLPIEGCARKAFLSGAQVLTYDETDMED